MQFSLPRKSSTVAAFLLAAGLLASVLTALAVSRALAADAASQGEWQVLFNGKDLEVWEGDSAFWNVEDGLLTGQTTAEKPAPHNTFLVWKGGKVGDFELHASYKVTGGNSGIQYRSKELGDHVISGYQADIDGGEADKYSGILYEEKGRGILAERGQKVVIIARGNHLVQKINGVTTIDVTDNQTAKAAHEGVLALQIHAGPPMKVQFTEIKLKALKD